MSSTSARTDTPKSSAKPTFSPDMKNFLALGGKLFGKKEISDVSKIIDENRDLEARIASLQKSKKAEITLLQSTKDSEIAELTTANAKLQSQITTLNLEKNILTKEFGEKYKSWDIRTSEQKQLKDEVAALNLLLVEANQEASDSEAALTDVQQQLIERQHELLTLQNKFESVKETLAKKDAELVGSWKKLKTCESTLQKQAQELGLEDMDLHDWGARFNDFVETNHKLAKKFFCTELVESESLTWENISTELYQPDLVKIIPKKYLLSNSIPSQHLRMAVAETIIAMIYHSDIFQPYYLPESDEIAKILNQLYKENPRREAIFRSQLRYAYKPEVEEVRVTSIVKSATNKVVGFLGPLLFAPNADRDFRSEFESVRFQFRNQSSQLSDAVVPYRPADSTESLLQEAVNLWRHVQRSAMRGFVENEPDSSWDEYEEYESAFTLRPDQGVYIPDEPSAIISLFPRVVVGKTRICPGYALWSNQSTAVAADLESKSRGSMNGLAGNNTGGRQRRGTRRFSSSGEDISQSPTSPLGNQRSLRHTQNRSISDPRQGGSSGTPGRQ